MRRKEDLRGEERVEVAWGIFEQLSQPRKAMALRAERRLGDLGPQNGDSEAEFDLHTCFIWLPRHI